MTQKNKKVSFSEDDAVILTERYDATTILILLQEVAHQPHAKIDWNEMVKKTSTGISDAREYQMLWRHLAYRDSLSAHIEEGAEPKDDDSDLDCELEAFPPVSAESASEAQACVKVMIASSTLSESTPSSSTIEAPLTISLPTFHSSGTENENSQPSSFMQGKNVIFPVTIPRQTLPTPSSTDGVETKGVVGSSMASKRKRKAWSEEEDMQLRAAVQRYGEGNWATMLKIDDFPIKRSPTQLAQRWSILRKKDGSTSSGTIVTSTQYTTAEQQATRHSLSLALDMPFKKLTAPGTTDPARTSFNISSKNQVQQSSTAEVSSVQSGVPPQPPSQGFSGSASISRFAPEKLAPKNNTSPNSALAATAIASGARIVSASDTTSQLKVPQARNIVSASSSSTKSSTLAGLPPESKSHAGTFSSVALIPSRTVVNAIPAPVSCTSTVKAAPHMKNNTPTTVSNLPKHDKHVISVGNEVTVKQEVSLIKESRVSDTISAPKESAPKEDRNLDGGKNVNLPMKSGTPIMEVKIEQVASDRAVSQNPTNSQDQGTTKNSSSISNIETSKNNQIAANSNLDKGGQTLDNDMSTNSADGSSENQSLNEKHVHLSSTTK